MSAAHRLATAHKSPVCDLRGQARAGASAHLLIHAQPAPRPSRGAVAAAWLSLLGLASLDAAGRSPARTRVTINTLEGSALRSIDVVDSPVDVLLSAGVYRVFVSRGPLERCYTVALRAGATLALHLEIVRAQDGP